MSSKNGGSFYRESIALANVGEIALQLCGEVSTLLPRGRVQEGGIALQDTARTALS